MTDTPAATRCYICGHANQQSLEEHHLVPQRLNGGDTQENTVFLCGSCHNAVESMYDDGFYRRLGIAVDGVDDDAFADRELGETVDPVFSIDRKMPANSAHIRLEEWIAHLSMKGVRNPNEIDTSHPDKIDDHIKEVVKENHEDIINAYERRKEEQEKLGHFDSDAPEWWIGGEVPIELNYIHRSQATVPVLKVTNPYENGIDYELKHESDEEIQDDVQTFERRQNRRLPDKPYSQMEDWEHGQKMGLSRRVEYPDQYRIHCGYCHTVFTQYEHSDAARHLRIRHGIRNPWEIEDTTFGEKKEQDGLFENVGGGD